MISILTNRLNGHANKYCTRVVQKHNEIAYTYLSIKTSSSFPFVYSSTTAVNFERVVFHMVKKQANSHRRVRNRDMHKRIETFRVRMNVQSTAKKSLLFRSSVVGTVWMARWINKPRISCLPNWFIYHAETKAHLEFAITKPRRIAILAAKSREFLRRTLGERWLINIGTKKNPNSNVRVHNNRLYV